jgi:hypothetical protein
MEQPKTKGAKRQRLKLKNERLAVRDASLVPFLYQKI